MSDKPTDVTDAEETSEVKQVLRSTSARLSNIASAVGRGAEAAAAKAKDVVDTTSDKLETVAQHGPAAVRSAAPAGPGAVAGTAGATASANATRTLRRTRKARLRISRIDPWSVMKTTFLFSIAFGIIQFVAVWLLWSVIGASGAFDSINKTVSDLVSSPGSTNTFQLQNYVNTHKVLGLSAIIGVIDVLLFTALATLGSFLYNLAATVLGGLELTLAED